MTSGSAALKKKSRGSEILDLAGFNVEPVLAQVGILGGEVVATLTVGPLHVLPHERPDVADGGAAVAETDTPEELQEAEPVEVSQPSAVSSITMVR